MNSPSPDRLTKSPSITRRSSATNRNSNPDQLARASTQRVGATDLTSVVAVQVLVHDLDDTQYDHDRGEVR